MYFLSFLYMFDTGSKVTYIVLLGLQLLLTNFLIIIQNVLFYFLIPAGTAQKLTFKVPLLVVFLLFSFPFFFIHFFFKVVSMECAYFALCIGSRNIHTSPTEGLFTKTTLGILINTQSYICFVRVFSTFDIYEPVRENLSKTTGERTLKLGNLQSLKVIRPKRTKI